MEVGLEVYNYCTLTTHRLIPQPFSAIFVFRGFGLSSCDISFVILVQRPRRLPNNGCRTFRMPYGSKMPEERDTPSEG